MTAENKFQAVRKASLLDKVVGVVTLGRYGVDETVGYGLKDRNTGEIFQESPIIHSLRTGRSIIVDDMSKTTHVLERKIVKRES